jgi:uncharacterized protein
MFYLDTSALVPLFLPETHTRVMQSWVGRETPVVMLGDFAAAEFCATVARHLRTAQITRRAADATLADFDEWRRQVRQQVTRATDVARCERLVRDFRLKLSAADALHLAIAIEEGLTLVTLDRRLAEASKLLQNPVAVPGAD